MSVTEKKLSSQQNQIKIPDSEIREFLVLVSKLSEIEFLGLVRFFKVKMVKEEKDAEGKSIPKDFYEILADTTEQFCLSNKKKRKDTLRVLKQAQKKPKKVSSSRKSFQKKKKKVAANAKEKLQAKSEVTSK